MIILVNTTFMDIYLIANNYNPDANVDDGSCVFCDDFPVLLIGISDVSSVGAFDGSVQATGTGGSNNYSLVFKMLMALSKTHLL